MLLSDTIPSLSFSETPGGLPDDNSSIAESESFKACSSVPSVGESGSVQAGSVLGAEEEEWVGGSDISVGEEEGKGLRPSSLSMEVGDAAL